MEIFVFGSNESGIHAGGAARIAELKYGALKGFGFGLSGNSFAVPTMDWQLKPLKIFEIAHYVNRFMEFAKINKNTMFHLTKIGCGIAGYSESDIAPLFRMAPENVLLIDEQGMVTCSASEWYRNTANFV